MNKYEERIKLKLLDNGIDFILTGVDELFTEGSLNSLSTKSFKYGVLHLFSGFLLLLKERLQRHLPLLIYTGKFSDIKRKISPPKKGAGQKPKKPNTVNLHEALERLEMGPKVTFSEADLEIIEHMQGYRNEFEHYEVSGDKHVLWSDIVEFLDLIDRFLVEHLDIKIESSVNSSELFEKITKIDRVWMRVREEMEKDAQDELILRREYFEYKREEVLADFERQYYLNKGDFQPFIVCSECGDETLIVYDEFTGICANSECSYVAPITECARCGRLMEGFPGDITFCNNCQLRMEKY